MGKVLCPALLKRQSFFRQAKHQTKPLYTGSVLPHPLRHRDMTLKITKLLNIIEFIQEQPASQEKSIMMLCDIGHRIERRY
jgi:hypothetical protein